jgi:hypothetical protein
LQVNYLRGVFLWGNHPEFTGREGMDRWAYRTAKLGIWERSLALDAQVAIQRIFS